MADNGIGVEGARPLAQALNTLNIKVRCSRLARTRVCRHAAERHRACTETQTRRRHAIDKLTCTKHMRLKCFASGDVAHTMPTHAATVWALHERWNPLLSRRLEHGTCFKFVAEHPKNISLLTRFSTRPVRLNRLSSMCHLVLACVTMCEKYGGWTVPLVHLCLSACVSLGAE